MKIYNYDVKVSLTIKKEFEYRQMLKHLSEIKVQNGKSFIIININNKNNVIVMTKYVY